MKTILKILLAFLVLLLPTTALATTAVPWSITNLTDGFIFPNLVNGSAKGILVSASSTFNGNLSVSTLTNGDCIQAGVGGILVSASSSCSSGGSSASSTLLSDTNTWTGTEDFTTNTGFNIAAPGQAVDILGKIRETSSLTDATNKAFFFLDRNFTNAQNDFLLAFGQSKSTGNTLIFGGGQTGFTAASSIAFFTGAGNNTDTGTSRLSIDATGNLVAPSLANGIVSGGTAGNLYDSATTTATCAGTTSCSTFTILGSSPVTITGSSGTSASSTLLGDTNTFSGTDIFSNTIKVASLNGLIGGNTGTLYAVSTSSLNASITGNAGTATALATGRTISITGDLTYTSPTFDGSGNVTAAGTLATVNGNVGSFTNANITVNAKGLITAASNGTAPTTYTGTYPIQVTGSVISTAFGTTTNWGIGTNGFLVTGPTGIPFVAASSSLSLPNTALQNSSVTVNGTAIALGASGTVTANTTNAVTFNSSGSGGSSPQVFNGSSAETISYNTIGAQVAGTYVTAVTATAPIFSSGGTTPNLIWAGLATTSQPSSSNVLTSNGAAGVYGSATTSATCTGNATCTAFTVLGSTPITINVTAGTTASSTLLGDTNTFSGTDIFSNAIKISTFSGLVAANGGLTYAAATSSIGAGTGLSFSGTLGAQVGGSNGTFSVNTTQNITTLSNLSSAGTLNNTSSGVLYSTATSTPTVSAPITYSGTLGQFIGGASGAFGCTTASAGVTGCLSGTDYNTFNGKENVLTFTWPLIRSTNTITFGGLSTTTNLTQGQIPYVTGVNTFGQVATGTETCSSGISCTGFSVIGSGAAITNTGVTSIVAGAGVSISGATGAVTITNTGSTFAYPFNTATNFATTTAATTTSIWLQGGSIYSSSTVASVLPYASTTDITSGNVDISGNTVSAVGLFLNGLGNKVGINSNGGTNFAQFDTSGLSANRIFTFPNSAGTFCLLTTCDTFAWPFTPLTDFGVNTSATGTPIWAQLGLFASSTSQIASTTFSISGNVGIGSSSPTSKLTLIQDNTSSLFTAFTIDGVTAGAGAEMALNRGANTGTEEANIDFNTNGAEFWQLGLQNNSTNDFELWDGIDDPVFTIKGGTNAIGFGTTTPFGDFAINADFGDAPGLIFNVASSSQSATTSVFAVSSSGQSEHAAGTASSPAITFIQDLASGIYQAVSGTLSFVTAGTEKMRLLANGNFGVGTTTPQWLTNFASSTVAQLALSSTGTNGNSHWTFNNIYGNLFLATSSASTFATSTNSDPNTGYIEFPNNGGCVGCTDVILTGGINLRNAKYVNATSSAPAATTYTTIYTAPTGRRALIFGAGYNNFSGSTLNFRLFYLNGGVDYPITASSTVGTGSWTSGGTAFILEPGESVQSFQSLTGGNIYLNLIEYDASVPFFTKKILGITSNATTTIYTAPTGTSALCIGSNVFSIGVGNGVNTTGNNCALWTSNFNASSALGTVFYLKPTQTPTMTLNEIAGGPFAGTNTTAPVGIAFSSLLQALAISANDSLMVANQNSWGTQSIAWLNIYEH